MANSGFTINGTDLDKSLVPKTYLLTRYPELVDSLKQAGLWAFGRGGIGTLGTGSVTNFSSPVQSINSTAQWRSASSSGYASSGVKTDNTLWTWGRNYTLGTLGQGTSQGDINGANLSIPTQVGALSTWKSSDTGYQHMGALRTDGTLWLWGLNSSGQLGDNATNTNSGSPIQTISGGTNWKSLSCGNGFTMAIKNDGTLWAWGYNANGNLGDSTLAGKSSPVQIGTATTWKTVSAGNNGGVALKSDGTLWTWGAGTDGVLGDNTITAKSSPVQTIAAGTNWKQAVTGFGSHIAAIKTDGTLWCWGTNTNGQLGNNTVTKVSSPIQTVAGGTNWYKVCAQQASTAAIKTDGSLWTWGINDKGQLGDGTVVSQSSPIQTIAGGYNWTSVDGKQKATFSIRDNSADYGIGSL